MTAPRLHALQGRANVECPRCGHGMHLHRDDATCAECRGNVAEVSMFDSALVRAVRAQSPCVPVEVAP